MNCLSVPAILLLAETVVVLALATVVFRAWLRAGRQARDLEDCLTRQYETHLKDLDGMIRRRTEALEQLEGRARSMDEWRKRRLLPLIEACRESIGALQEAFERALTAIDLDHLDFSAPPVESVDGPKQLLRVAEVVREFVPPEEHQQTLNALEESRKRLDAITQDPSDRQRVLLIGEVADEAGLSPDSPDTMNARGIIPQSAG